jgi:hypothetical protein
MTDVVDKNLSNFLNIEAPVPPPPKEIVVHQAQEQTDDKKEADFEIARTNIKTLLVKGEEALDGILYLAQNSDHPRAYEVAGQLIKTLVDANKDLMGLHKTGKEGREKASTVIEPTITNNSIFVGTTNDLQKLIKERKENNADV